MNPWIAVTKSKKKDGTVRLSPNKAVSRKIVRGSIEKGEPYMPESVKNDGYQPITFDAIKIGLASPEKIREWSHGEVLAGKPSTTEL